MTVPAPTAQRAVRRPGLSRPVLFGVALFVILGLVGEALIFANYLQVTRNVRPQFARATQLLPQLSGLQTAVQQLHIATTPLLAADIPDFRAVDVLRPDVQQRLDTLRRDAAGDPGFEAALDQVANMLEAWDVQMEILHNDPDIPTAAVMEFEVQRSFTVAETALQDLYAVEEADFYASTGQAFVALGNIQGVLLGLGVLIAGTGALLFVVLRRSARTEVEHAYARLQDAAEVGRVASSILDVERLLAQVVNLVRDRFGFYHASIFLLDERGERAILREATGEAGQRLKSAGHALGVGSQSIIGWVTENWRPRIAGDVAGDPVHFVNELLPETRAELAVPLIADGRLLGALDVQAREANAFTEVDVRALQSLGDQVAIAIANAAEYGSQQIRSQKLRALSEAALQLAEPQGALDDLLHLAARRAMAVVNAEGAAIWLPVSQAESATPPAGSLPGADEIELKVWYRGQSAQPAGRRLLLDEGLVGRVWREGRPAQVEAGADGLPGRPVLGLTGSGGGAVATGLIVPMAWQSGMVGLLVLARFRPGAHFSEEERDVARLFGSQTAAAVENFRLITETRARVAELSSLNQISTALTRETPADLGRALRAAAEQMQALFGMDHVRLVLLDAQAAAGDVAAEFPDWGMTGQRLPVADYPLVQQMLAERAFVWVADAAADPRLGAAARQDLLERGVRTLVLVPLLTRENTLGFAGLESQAARPPLSETEINLCMTITAQVAIAVQNAGLYDQNSRQARRERLINEITERIRRAVDVPGVLAATAGELGAALGARRARIEISPIRAESPASPAGRDELPPAGPNGNGGQPAAPNGREAAQ